MKKINIWLMRLMMIATAVVILYAVFTGKSVDDITGKIAEETAEQIVEQGEQAVDDKLEEAKEIVEDAEEVVEDIEQQVDEIGDLIQGLDL